MVKQFESYSKVFLKYSEIILYFRKTNFYWIQELVQQMNASKSVFVSMNVVTQLITFFASKLISRLV